MRRKATIEVEYEVTSRPFHAEEWETIITGSDLDFLRRVRVDVVEDVTVP